MNLTKIATKFKSSSKTDSIYRRIQNFFQKFSFDELMFAEALLKIIPAEKYTFIIDRTNWEFGRKKNNFLILAVLIGKVSLPLISVDLNKSGNSNSKERMDLMKKLLRIIGKEKIADISADREFVGDDWIDYLSDEEIPFTIRQKADNHFGRQQIKTVSQDLTMNKSDYNIECFYKRI